MPVGSVESRKHHLLQAKPVHQAFRSTFSFSQVCLRQLDPKRTSFSDFRFHPTHAAHAPDSALYNRQPNASAGIRLTIMQALKNLPDTLAMLRSYSDPIVYDAQTHRTVVCRSRQMNFRRYAFLVEFDRIGEKIERNLCQSLLMSTDPQVRRNLHIDGTAVIIPKLPHGIAYGIFKVDRTKL